MFSFLENKSDLERIELSIKDTKRAIEKQELEKKYDEIEYGSDYNDYHDNLIEVHKFELRMLNKLRDYLIKEAEEENNNETNNN